MSSLLNLDEEIEKIYERQADTVYRVCFSFMKNASDAEDMVQETFLKLISCKKKFESEEHEKAWLIVTASNTCKDELRRLKRRLENMNVFMHRGNTVQREDSEIRQQVLDLPVKYRQVIYLYYYEGYRTAEIADMFHCSESTIRNQLLRGRKILQRNSTYGAKSMLLPAAVLAGSLLVTTAVYAVHYYRLHDLGVGKEEVLDLSGLEEHVDEIAPEEIPVREADIITLGGVAESPEYRACSEWKEFLKEYDADGTILSEIGNDTAELEEEYRLVYGCYSQEMADKVNELCAKYGLFRLKGFYLVEDYADLCRRAVIGAVCGGVPGNVGWDFYYGYVYDDGTFLMEGRIEVRESATWESESVSWVSDYQMIRTVKGSFNPVTLNVGEIEEYRQWNYATKSGEILLLANSSEKALIIADRKASFIVVNVLGDFSGETFQVSDEMLEEMAEAFQFSEIP
ncbi:MAG: sigma-70 family RNA polymerase sigma factor [Acetatifactor sp.]|nr:sigma-70 family RNA polymerase sigma factor [Acetatifactor sp.]